MYGNVREWCWDAYDENYYARSPVDDPHGPDRGGAAARVIRGGSWFNVAEICRPAHRFMMAPDNRIFYLGFRVARVRSGQ
jgi:formylglycine-generating enzyme required for sulfatase activity